MEELYVYREKKCGKQYSYLVSPNLAAGVPSMRSVEHLFRYIIRVCVYIYIHIYMYNIYILFGITVCHLRAVLWIMITGSAIFFFFFRSQN